MTRLHFDSPKKFYKLLYLLPAICLITFIAWGYSTPVQTSAADFFVVDFFHEGWSQQIGDDTIPLDDIHDFLPVSQGESLVFTCTLPQLDDDKVFLFYSVRKEVLCYIDGELIQSFLIPEGMEALKTPGNAWNQVDLDSSMSGKNCTLIFHSPLGIYNSLGNIHLIRGDFVNTVRFDSLWLGGISAILLLMSTFSVLGATLASTNGSRKRYYLAITLYFLAVLFWMLAKLNAFDILFSRPIISYLLVELFRRTIPLGLLNLAVRSTSRLWHPRIIYGLRNLLWLNLLIILLLPPLFGISILELEIVHYALSMLTIFMLILIWLEKLIHFKNLRYEEYPFLAILFLLLGGGFDLIYSSIFGESYPFWGIGSALGCLLFSMVTFALLAYTHSHITSEKAQLEYQCNNLENATLMKQIEAHFIFNALNVVSAYCKIDPPKADEAVKSLANYLRSYLHLLGRTDNIPFETELEMVRHYLALQQMRFGDDLQYQFDAAFTAFDVPPFVVHTFVENSIIHGFKRAGTSGMIHISSKRIGDTIEIIVADDGVGFDLNQPPKDASVGVANARRRLGLMRHGSIVVDSTIGHGTKVTLTLPVDMPPGARL